ncbi:MAG: hydroxyisourate hydrolase [Candidatus Sericytochromatia bacterium]
MGHLTTHVLDTSIGKPASNIHVLLEFNSNGNWEKVTTGITNHDGRIPNFLPDDNLLEKGVYRITFETDNYFNERGVTGFYPYVSIVFKIESEEHYHVPLLLNPYGYSTYRGS